MAQGSAPKPPKQPVKRMHGQAAIDQPSLSGRGIVVFQAGTRELIRSNSSNSDAQFASVL